MAKTPVKKPVAPVANKGKGKSPNEFAQKDKQGHSAFSLAKKLKERKKANRALLDSI